MSNLQQQVRVRKYLWRVVEVTALLLLVAVVFLLFAWSLTYILPFVAAWFFAVLLLPLVRWMEKHRVRRSVATLIVVIGLIVAVGLISTYVTIAVAREAVLWSVSVPQYFDTIQRWITHQIETGQKTFGALPTTVSSSVESTAISILQAVEKWLQTFATGMVKSITKLPEYLFVVVVAVISTYFMLINREKMYTGFLRTLPPGWAVKVELAIKEMLRAFIGTIRAQVVLVLMSAVLGVVGLSIMGIKYAIILGVLFGVSGIVPILGSAVVSIPWAIAAFLVGDVPLGIKVLMLQLVISLIRHIVEPKILAESVGLDTLSTLFALYVGMKLLGVVGLFIGPIVLIGIKSMLKTRLFVDFLPETFEAENDVSEEEPVGAGRSSV